MADALLLLLELPLYPSDSLASFPPSHAHVHAHKGAAAIKASQRGSTPWGGGGGEGEEEWEGGRRRVRGGGGEEEGER